MRKQNRILKDYSRRKSEIFGTMRKILEKPRTDGGVILGSGGSGGSGGGSAEESVKSLIKRIDKMRTLALRGDI